MDGTPQPGPYDQTLDTDSGGVNDATTRTADGPLQPVTDRPAADRAAQHMALIEGSTP